MRTAVLGLVVLLLPGLLWIGGGASRAEEEAPAERAGELTDTEREQALKRAAELSNRVVECYGQGKFLEAIAAAQEALEITETVLGADHPDVASSLNNLAALHAAQGDGRKAKPLYERALTIKERALGRDHPSVATGLNNLAMLLKTLGDYEEAQPLFERALAIAEAALGANHPQVAQSVNNLAALLVNLGRYEDARPLYERAIRICEQAEGPEHPSVALSLNNLGLLLKTLGAYEEARPRLERALGIYEAALGTDHPSVAMTLTNLAGLYLDLGQFAQARPLQERALVIDAKCFGPDHVHVGVGLNNLAMLLKTLGAYEEARSHYERALEIYEAALSPTHPAVAQVLHNLASLLRVQGAHAKARTLYERAIEIREQRLGPAHPVVAESLTNLAVLLHAQGADARARELCERALKIDEAAFGPDHLRVAYDVLRLASLDTATGSYESAGVRFERCLDLVERHVRRNLVGLLPAERLALTRSLRRFLDGSLELAPHLMRSGHAEVLRFKGLVARVTAAERRLIRAGGAAAGVRVDALRAAEWRIGKLSNAMPPMFQHERHQAWQEAYAKAADERESRARELARDVAPYRAGLERLDLALADLQAQLGPDEALVDLLRSRDRYLAWIVRSKGDAERVDLGAAEAIEGAATVFTEQAGSAADDTAWLESAANLRERVFAPVAERLGDQVRTVYLCPDAALAAVPFAALPGRETGRLLLDDYVLIRVSMAQDLVPSKEARRPGRGALLVGGVDYRRASAGATERVEPPQPLLARVDRAPRGGSYADLPATREEIRSIRALLGEGVSVLTGATATEAGVRAGGQGRRVLHLATHGFVRDDLMGGLDRSRLDTAWLGAGMERQLARGHDPMLLAGLALAGANPRDGGHGDDGILTALEASHLVLDGVHLVVLSACQTARGTAESGEGVIGLVQGFQMAGAKQVIGSLWRVDDEATRALMVRFYELWSPKSGARGLTAAAALTEAQRHVRRHEAWQHPYYWAAWSLWGCPD